MDVHTISRKDARIFGYSKELPLIDKIKNIPYISPIGYNDSKFATVYKINTAYKSQLVNKLITLFNSGHRSTGMTFLFVNDQSSANTSLLQNIHVVAKLEDWTSACLPNSVERNNSAYESVEEYIEKKEEEMTSELMEFCTTMRIYHKTHVEECPAKYGQFQFVGGAV